MPELPEVETTLRGIRPHLLGRRIARVVVRDARLRWPVPEALVRGLRGQVVTDLRRRGKYLLLGTARGTALLHLGMSGSLRVVRDAEPPGPHDHLDLVLEQGVRIRLRDPRRFGAALWTTGDPLAHPLLAHLGPEPLGDDFDGAVLFARSRGRTAPVKAFLMDARVVVGVGNIYASEALHRAGVHPERAAGRISRARYDRLATAIRAVLQDAIAAGGTTLRDFLSGSGEPGYFRVRLDVYERAGEPCRRCGAPIRRVVTGQRATYYCPGCQR